MATWVISTRKSFVVGSISMSEYGKASWHASGSVKQRTLLHATSALPQKQNYNWSDNKRDGSDNSLGSQMRRRRYKLYASPAITSDQCTYFDVGDIAERHSVASSFLACQRLRAHWHLGDDRSGQPSPRTSRSTSGHLRRLGHAPATSGLTQLALTLGSRRQSKR